MKDALVLNLWGTIIPVQVFGPEIAKTGNGSIVKRHFEYKKIDEIDEHLLFEENIRRTPLVQVIPVRFL